MLQRRKSKPAGLFKSVLAKWPIRGLLAKKLRTETAKKVREDHYPAPFRLIDLFETHGGNLEALKHAETRAFAVLRAIVGTMAPPARVEAISLTAWCIVHGYATLCIETGIETAGRRAERAREFARTIAAAAG